MVMTVVTTISRAIPMSSEERPGLVEEHSLSADAAECEHCKPAILKLLQPHVPRLALVCREEVLAQEEIASIAFDLALISLKAQPAAIDLKDADGCEERSHEACRNHLVVGINGGHTPH